MSGELIEKEAAIEILESEIDKLRSDLCDGLDGKVSVKLDIRFAPPTKTKRRVVESRDGSGEL